MLSRGAQHIFTTGARAAAPVIHHKAAGPEPPLAGLLFVSDVGNTLFFPKCSVVSEALYRALRVMDYRGSKEDVEALLGLPKEETLRRALEQEGRSPASVADHLPRLTYLFHSHLHDAILRCDPAKEVLPGAADLVRHVVSKGGTFAMDTGFSAHTMDLVRFVFKDRFPWRLVASVCPASPRPSGDAIRALETRFPETSWTVKFGDTVADMASGRDAGARCIGLATTKWAIATRSELIRAGAECVVRSPREAAVTLLDWTWQ